LLKVKSFLDAEARVIEHLPGEGRHKGRLGALVVETAGGTRFSVGTGFSDAEREAPPALGSVITFRYQELSTGGVPRFPSYIGVRDDVNLKPTSARAPGSEPPSIAPPSPPPATQAPVAKRRRRFEFVDDASSKFWEIEVREKELSVCFGRIGSKGQSKTKSFASAIAAQQEADRLIAEKAAKGYRELA
jgi:DNA ligase-1